MKIICGFLDNEILLPDGKVLSLEIENTNYFYRFVKNLFLISNGISDVEIKFYNEIEQINLNNKINIITNYFNFNFDSKKVITSLNKYINSNIDDEVIYEINKLYTKIVKIYNSSLNDIDLPLINDNEINIETITKMLNIRINEKDTLLENLLLLIDVNSLLKLDEYIIFINLKQYLNSNELVELLKYSLYKNIKLILIDSQSYNINNEYIKKVVIDRNLNEIMI